MDGVDLGSLILRVAIGGTMVAHGWNHAFGGGKLDGTARWFESIGIRPGGVHARAATVTEIGAGLMLILGLFTPVAAGAVVGSMGVAMVANHLGNGFFIFRPGEGYEYVLNLILGASAVGARGGGAASFDAVLGLEVGGWAGLGIAVGMGGLGAAVLLATCWRPRRTAEN